PPEFARAVIDIDGDMDYFASCRGLQPAVNRAVTSTVLAVNQMRPISHRAGKQACSVATH
ncbi:MAG: hypothetical protein WD396_03645, partial [Pseudohongiellaceae bacterium]